MRELAALEDDDGNAVDIDPSDLPPPLEWEQGVYEIYQLIRTQWQYSMAGRTCLMYERAEKIAAARGYDLELFIDCLRAIEYAELKHDAEEREQEQQKRGR